MPVIPFQERQIVNRPVEVPTISPIAAGMAGAEVERAGARLEQMGDRLADFSQAQQRAEQVLELSTAKVNLDTDMDTFRASFEERTDYKQFAADYAPKFDEIRKQYQQRVSPDVWRVLQPTVENKIAQTRAQIDHYGRKLFVQEGVEQVGANFDEAAKQYAYLSDPTDRQLKRAQIELDLGGAVAAGFIRPGQKDKMLAGLDNHADKFASEMLIQQNPEVAYAALSQRDQSGQYVNYPALQPEERAQRLKEAESFAWTKFARLEKQERELQEDVKLKTYTMLDAVEAGKMTPKAFIAEIDRATQRDPVTGIRPMTPDTGRHMKRELERTLKGEGGEGQYRDATAYSSYLDKIVSGTMTAEDKRKLETEGRLTYAEKKELLRAVIGTERKEDSAEKKAQKEYTKFVADGLFKEIDAKLPKEGKTKDINASLKAVIYANQRNYDDPNQFKEWATSLIDWTKKESSGLFASKGKVRDALQGLIGGSTSPTTTQPVKVGRFTVQEVK